MLSAAFALASSAPAAVVRAPAPARQGFVATSASAGAVPAGLDAPLSSLPVAERPQAAQAAPFPPEMETSLAAPARETEGVPQASQASQAPRALLAAAAPEASRDESSGAFEALKAALPLAEAPAGSRDETVRLAALFDRVRRSPGAPLAALAGLPIVVVPGLNWDLLGKTYFQSALARLRELGAEPRLLRTDPLGDHAGNTALIRAAIEASEGPVLLLGHSRGGVEAVEALRRFPGLAAKVLAVATVNAPHRGTLIADWLARRHWVYAALMAAGRLLNPLRLLATDPRRWRQGIRELSVAYRSALEPFSPGVPVFSVASSFNPANLAMRIKSWFVPAFFLEPNDGIVPSAGGIFPGSRYALVDGLGHLAPAADAGWRARLSGMGGPYRGFGGDLAEAMMRWILEKGA